MAELSHRFCACGCGQRTTRMTKTATRVGRVKGHANRYVAGHVPVHLLRAKKSPKVKTPEEIALTREKIRLRSSREYYKNHEKRLADAQAARDADPEKYREKARAAYRRNPEAFKKNAKAWRDNNLVRARENARSWRERNAGSDEYREARRAREAARRARKRGSRAEVVHPFVVLERDDGTCGLCGGDVDPLAFHVDHIIPLALGGTHEYANVQVAHPTCNLQKGCSL